MNIVRNLQILYFSKKKQINQKTKKWQKKVAQDRHLYILLR